MFLKVLMLMRQMCLKSVLFATVGILKIKDLLCNQLSATAAMYCVDYCCIINGISKSEAINLVKDINFNEKTSIIVKDEQKTFNVW